MRYLSVCSGIEAATVAWHELGWQPVAFSEIDAFPSAVLAHHYPDVPNLGDMSRFAEWPDAAVDVLVGGTPCQSFSVAGLRKGLDDPRGNLMLTFGAIARRYRPQWLVWENVPGVLSSNGGRDFGSFLGLLGELGYGFAYRVLDAQFFGLAQRRRRVFVVGHARDWRCAAAVLLERESMSGNPVPRREAQEGVAGTVAGGARGRGGYSEDDIPHVACPEVSPALKARDSKGPSSDGDGDGAPLISYVPPVSSTVVARSSRGGGQINSPGYNADQALIAHTLRAAGFDADGRVRLRDPGFNVYEEHAPTLDSGSPHAVAFQERGREHGREIDVGGDIAYALTAPSKGGRAQERNLAVGMQVRRLTPRECERLQGFPDDYTLIPIAKRQPVKGRLPVVKMAADGPRYKALGNSMAVPVMRWIGKRIAMVDAIQRGEAAA